jgi:hypothetical protein
MELLYYTYRSVLSVTHVGRIQMIQAQLEVGAHCRVRWGVLSSPWSQIRSVEPTTESDQEFLNTPLSQIRSVELTAESDQECWAHRGVRSGVLNPSLSQVRSVESHAKSDREYWAQSWVRVRSVEPAAKSNQDCWLTSSQTRSIEPTAESDQRCQTHRRIISGLGTAELDQEW